MTAHELIEWVGKYPLVLLVAFTVPAIAAWVIGCIHGRNQGKNSPWKYLYSLIVYVTCIPGVFAAVLTGYSLFFTKQNLLDANLLVYLLPIVSMVATLFLVRRSVEFEDVPGFDRLSGLIAMMAVSFILALAILKTRIWIVFGGPIQTLVAFAIGFFALFKWGGQMFFRRKDDPKLPPPSFPGT
jgi:hypothetical protein